jgi:hypothetical protein
MGKMISGACLAVGLVAGRIAVGFPTTQADIISPAQDYVAATIMYGKNLPVENWEPAY